MMAVIMTAISCSEETKLEQETDVITISANCSGHLVKSDLKYTDFDIYTKYLLYAITSSETYDWNNCEMYDRMSWENEQHLIDYGKDLFFDGKSLDFYGVSLCSTRAYPQNSNQPGSPIIDFNAEVFGGTFPDLMYSNNLKNCSAQAGVLEMNFTHALSKVQVEISRQDIPSLENTKVKKVSITNTASTGKLDIVNGVWSDTDNSAEMLITDELTNVTVEHEVMKKDGQEAYTLIIPNESSKDVLNIHIILETDNGEKEFTYPLYGSPARTAGGGDPTEAFIFRQNCRYVLSIILLDDGVRVVAINPQAYDWIDVPVHAHMGQPLNFGGLMWMDRNLGAISADCENEWENTRGFYYQHGRNIPYIFDHEKFLNRNKSVKNEFRTQEGKTSQLDVGYEYFFTYNDKEEKVYGAVQGGTLTWHYFYHVAALNVDGQIKGWENNGSGWVWNGSKLTNYELKSVPHFLQTNGNFNNGTFWTVENVGYNGATEGTGAPVWTGPNVTTSNIAINPGDPGIYHFIFDARYYHDYLQSGAWCVNDCQDPFNWDHWRAMSDSEWSAYNWSRGWEYPAFKDWLLNFGCPDTRTEDTEKVNFLWADQQGNPIPDNHPCPKGWRIPTREDFAGIVPDHNIENSWASENNRMFVVDETYGDVLTQYKEAVIYGVDDLGRKVIYIIKRKGENECYRLRLLWKDSNLTRNNYYGLTSASGDQPMQYLEISRYPGSSDMTFDKYFNASVGSLTTTNQSGGGGKSARVMTGTQLRNLGFFSDYNWDKSTEVMQIPICGFIYTSMGVDGMFGDGDMTILRCTDWSTNYDVVHKIRPVEEGGLGESYTEGAYPYNEAMNWCMYVRTDRNTGLFSGSRKCLGAQIRCVRDINAND